MKNTEKTPGRKNVKSNHSGSELALGITTRNRASKIDTNKNQLVSKTTDNKGR